MKKSLIPANKQFRGSAFLLVASLIWGGAFVAQSVGMDYVGPFTFNAVRSYIGTLFLIPVIIIISKIKKRDGVDHNLSKEEKKANKRWLIIGGVCCGVFLSIASIVQQVGIKYTSVGKAGFLTALYIVIVPIIGIFIGRKSSLMMWVSVAVALVGTYLLSVTGDFSIGSGDLLLIISAVFFSIHILLVDKFSPNVDGVKLSAIQFFISGTISIILAFIFENPQISEILSAWWPLLYTGIMSSGVAYTFQILGQRTTAPAVASIIMSMESVFAAVFGWLILRETLSPREILGCILVFAAVLLAQMPTKHTKIKKEKEQTKTEKV